MNLVKLARFLPRVLREKLFWGAVRKAGTKAGLPEAFVNDLVNSTKSKATTAVAVLGGVGMVVAGLLTAAQEIASGTYSWEHILGGFGLVKGGWAAVVAGLGFNAWAGKKEKENAAVLLNSPDVAVREATKAALVEKGITVP